MSSRKTIVAPKKIITVRIRRMKEGNYFQSVHTCGGGEGDTPSSRWGGGYPHLVPIFHYDILKNWSHFSPLLCLPHLAIRAPNLRVPPTPESTPPQDQLHHNTPAMLDWFWLNVEKRKMNAKSKSKQLIQFLEPKGK